MMRTIKTYVRYVIRSGAFRAGASGSGSRRTATAAYWNEALSTWAKPYLGGNVGVDVRDSVTLDLLRHAMPSAGSMLDLGCASGSLYKKARATFSR